MTTTGVIVIGMLVFLNVFYALLTYLDKRKSDERENRLVKAIMARSVQEYSAVESSPADEINKLKVENELATKAVEISGNLGGKDRAIPIT